MFDRIRQIVGRQNDFDVRHIDSAYKTGCRFFFTKDKNNILRKRGELFSLLGVTFYHPEDDWADFLRLLHDEGNA